jgi:hypothetical protein
MATVLIQRNSSRKGKVPHPTKYHEERSRMTATDKLIEKNCLLAELKRLAAKKR